MDCLKQLWISDNQVTSDATSQIISQHLIIEYYQHIRLLFSLLSPFRPFQEYYWVHEKKIKKACLLGVMMQNGMSDPFHCIKKLAHSS